MKTDRSAPIHGTTTTHSHKLNGITAGLCLSHGTLAVKLKLTIQNLTNRLTIKRLNINKLICTSQIIEFISLNATQIQIAQIAPFPFQKGTTGQLITGTPVWWYRNMLKSNIKIKRNPKITYSIKIPKEKNCPVTVVKVITPTPNKSKK